VDKPKAVFSSRVVVLGLEFNHPDTNSGTRGHRFLCFRRNVFVSKIDMEVMGMKIRNVNIISCLGFALSVVSCGQQNVRDDEAYRRFEETRIRVDKNAIEVELPDKVGISFDSIISRVSYVKLQTGPDCLIGQIYDIKKDSDILFIRDVRAKKLLLFSTEGKYIRTINHLGRGPGEYLGLSDYKLDTSNDLVYILDGENGKLLCYDYDGKYLSSVPLSGRFSNHFLFLNDSIVAIDAGYRIDRDSPGGSYNLELYDIKSGKTEAGFFPYDPNRMKLRNANDRMSEYQNNGYVWEMLDNKAYRITPDSLVLAYSVNGEPLFPRHFLGLSNKELREERTKKAYVELTGFIEMDDWFFASVSKGAFTVSNFVRKDSRASYFDLSYMNMKNGKQVILPNVVALDGTTMCGWADAIAVESMGFIPEETKKGLSIQDNPVLVFYELKP
jgi:hypothetical protein